MTDKDTSDCITKRKKKLSSVYEEVEEKNILIVIKEIEAWYLAGVGKQFAKKHNLKIPSNTDEINKTKFKVILKSSDFDEGLDMMQEIAKRFDIELAKKRNTSFSYFWNKYLS
jgi:hypothetical protein